MDTATPTPTQIAIALTAPRPAVRVAAHQVSAGLVGNLAILLAAPETQYLKCAIFRVEK